LLRAFSKIYGDKGVIFSGGADPRLRFLGERQDLEEMIGNLLDNAGKWPKSRVTIDVCVEGASRPTLPPSTTMGRDLLRICAPRRVAWAASRRTSPDPVSACRLLSISPPLWRLAAARRQPQRRFCTELRLPGF
jgi:hypothetical protein